MTKFLTIVAYAIFPAALIQRMMTKRFGVKIATTITSVGLIATSIAWGYVYTQVDKFSTPALILMGANALIGISFLTETFGEKNQKADKA